MKIIKKLDILLNRKQKIQMFLLMIGMLVGAVLETFSIALVIPIVTLVITPESFTENDMLVWMGNTLGFQEATQLTVFVMILLIIAFVVKNLFLFMQHKWFYHFIYTNQFDTSKRLMRYYVNKGYEFYLNADTAVIQRNITSDVNNMYSWILSFLTVVSEGVVLVILGIVLIILDFWMSLTMIMVLTLTVLFVKAKLKPILYQAGEENQHCYAGLFKCITQTVTGIKEIKAMGRESYFIRAYDQCGKGFVDAVQKYSLYSNAPRLLIETVVIAAMVSYMLFAVLSNQSMEAMIPTLSAFALAGARLMPCANRLSNQLNNMAYFEPFFMGISDHLQEQIEARGDEEGISSYGMQERVIEKLALNKEISVKDITYAYPNSYKNIFTKASMKIPVGSSVGVVGTSGAGKSTIIDVLLGLLEIEEGSILADDVAIQSNYQGWLRNVGYIPQMIFMLDDTIRRNIAFGVVDDDINEEQVWHVLKEAQLDEFVRSLPEGLETTIGERGIRLSGGQRQRIGIARALYEDPEVLILDEATSALDDDTESAIMQSIHHLHGKKTLLIIAHRLQTIEKCDMVYRVESEKIQIERG
ncbi:MAG: ABC transporter ATP-binding protein [Eubacteriales bacterium]